MAELLEFGPFRLDVSSRSLYRGGEFVAVTPKAFEILRLLVENGPRVVTKEEILQRVWPEAFVEEGSIANNISALRKILNPHFEGDGPIATIARRGYRFTVPVQVRKPEAPIAPAPPAPVMESDGFPGLSRAEGSRRFTPTLLIATAIVIIVAIGLGLAMRRPAPTPAAAATRRSVAVLPMKNLSGDVAQQWLATALAETISAELAGGNQFRVVSGENVVRMQQELAPPAGVGLTRKQLDDIGRDLACDLILSGNYLVVGGKIRVDVRLDEVATGEAIASATITDTSDRFLEIVSRAGSELRSTIGLTSPATGDAQAMRAAFAATPEALRQYFQGLEALRLRDGPRARDLLTAAIAADDQFALAHSALSTTWRLLGYDTRGAESAKRAMELSARLSPEDRLGVEAQFYEATASWPKAIERYQQLWTLHPDNIEYGLKLGNAQWLASRPKDTLVTVEQLRKLPERDSRDSRIDLLEASAADLLPDYPRATAAAARAADKAIAAQAKLMLARARIKQGIYAVRLSKRDEALTYLVEAETLFAEMKDTGGVADAVRWQGNAVSTENPKESARQLERAYKIAAPLNYVRLATEIQIGLADSARVSGDLVRSIALAEAAATSAREADNRSAQARALTTLGSALRLQGQFARAREVQQQSADLFGSIGDTRGQNAAINNMAVIDFLTGDLASARRKYESVLASDRQINLASGIALRLNNLSRIALLQDRLADAESMNAEECKLQESLKATTALAWCRVRLADIQLERGHKPDAEQLAAKITIAALGSTVTSPVYIARLARLQVALGQVDAAALTIAAAEKVQATAGAVEEQAIQVSTIAAEIEAAQGRRAEAIARLTRARRDADRLGLVPWSLDARLALSRIDRREAAATERAAREAGFLLIARQAHALMGSS